MKLGTSPISTAVAYLVRLRFPFRWALILIGLQLGLTLFEALSVTLLLPLLDVAQQGGEFNNLTTENTVLKLIYMGLDWIGITATLTSLSAIIFVCVVIRQFFQAAFHFLNSRTSNFYMRDLRFLLFEGVLRARTAYLLKITTGELVNDIVTEIERASAALFSVVSFIGMAMLFCAYVVTAIAISSWTVVFGLGLIGVFFLLLKRNLKSSFKTGDTVAVLNRRVSDFLFERIRLVRLIRLTGSASVESKGFGEIVRELHKQRLHISWLGAKIPLIIQPIAFAIILTFLIFGTSVLSLDFIVTIVLIGIIVRLLPIIQELAMRSQAFLGSFASIKRVHDRVVELEAMAEIDEGGQSLTAPKQCISFEDVTFNYQSNDDISPALKNVSFEIVANSFTAIVGASGAGKSTLVDMLARLHEPDEGRILIDGVCLDQFALSEVQASIAFVSQTPLLLNTSIDEHIAYSTKDAADETVREAAKLAGADEFILTLPDGYKTRLNEDGSRLSGGQRQRIEIARALFRKAPILILDEPATGLDIQAEQLLHSTIKRINRETNTTVIVISHELSSISDADRIIVLKSGCVAGVGTHNSLLQQAGWYSETLQKLNEESEKRKASTEAD